MSDDTLLRTVKRGAQGATDALHVIGIDDLAWQKGQPHYSGRTAETSTARRRSKSTTIVP